MSRALVHLNLWLLGALLVVGLPLVTVAVQAVVRRLAPDIVAGEHNEVAGFLIAVVGVVYAATLASPARSGPPSTMAAAAGRPST